MTALKEWQALRQGVLAQLMAEPAPEKAEQTLKHAISQVAQNTLAAQEDDTLRQQVGMAFSDLQDALPAMRLMGEPAIWTTDAPKKGARVWPFFAASGAALLAACVLDYLAQRYWPLALVAVGAVMIACGLLLFLRQDGKAQEKTRVEHKIDPEKWADFIDRRMADMDTRISDLSILNRSLRASLTADKPGVDAASMELLTQMLEALQTENKQLTEQLVESTVDHLRAAGVEAIDYSPDKRQFFTIMDAKQGVRTITPALISLEDGKLIRRGTAAVAKDQE